MHKPGRSKSEGGREPARICCSSGRQRTRQPRSRPCLFHEPPRVPHLAPLRALRLHALSTETIGLVQSSCAARSSLI
eukprot:scaffold267609_cov31-Tisochrysis_lutea.AAC.4